MSQVREVTEQQAGDGATAAADISVAVIEQSERSGNLIEPLQATEMDVAVDPKDPYERDIVVVDTPDREMAYEVLKKPFHDSTLVFRMRGDPFFGIGEWIDSRVKTWLAKHVVMPGVDGCITITPYHAQLFEEKTGVWSGVGGLPADPSQWPETTHTDSELRITTLTNPVYLPKIQPLIDAMPVVDGVLSDVGGYWRICGRGQHADKLERSAAQFKHVEFAGYVDAYDELDWANCMVHLSNLDGWPNAVLEGMSSQLPVITNDHHAFVDRARPNDVCGSHDGLRAALRKYADPDWRQVTGERGERYVREHHDPREIGAQYTRYFQLLLAKQRDPAHYRWLDIADNAGHP